jgi:hypothetical protein
MTFQLNFPNHEQVTAICKKIRNNRRWAYVTLVVDEKYIYKNNHQLIGIIKFGDCCSLNWLHQNISPIGNKQTLLTYPNQWIEDFKKDIEDNLNNNNNNNKEMNLEEINDGLYTDY